MTVRHLALFVLAALVVSLAIWWPAQRAELPGPRPTRPPHPIEIYRPPGGH